MSHCRLQTSHSSTGMSHISSETATRHFEMLLRVWGCLSHCIVVPYESHVTAAQLCIVQKSFGRIRRTSCANPQHRIIHNPGYLCAFQNCTYFITNYHPVVRRRISSLQAKVALRRPQDPNSRIKAYTKLVSTMPKWCCRSQIESMHVPKP